MALLLEAATGDERKNGMDYLQIANMPTTLDRTEIEAQLKNGCQGFHESVLRSYNILTKVKWLLDKGTDPVVISELIAVMESNSAIRQVTP